MGNAAHHLIANELGKIITKRVLVDISAEQSACQFKIDTLSLETMLINRFRVIARPLTDYITRLFPNLLLSDARVSDFDLERFISICPASFKIIIEKVIQDEVKQINTFMRDAENCHSEESSASIKFITRCEGDPHSQSGRVRGFSIGGRRFVFRPGDNAGLIFFGRIASSVAKTVGASYIEPSYVTTANGIIVEYIDTYNKFVLSDENLYTAGVLIALCEAIRATDIHDENLITSELGWRIIDADMLFTSTHPIRYVRNFGKSTRIIDSPLCSSLLPIWMKQIPDGLAYRAGLFGPQYFNESDTDCNSTLITQWLEVETKSLKPLMEGYRALITSRTSFIALPEHVRSFIGSYVRFAPRPTAEYGLYRDFYIRCCLSGADAERELELVLVKGHMFPEQLQLELFEISSASIPKFVRKTTLEDEIRFEKTFSGMRRNISDGENLIISAIKSAFLKCEQEVLQACAGNLDQPLSR